MKVDSLERIRKNQGRITVGLPNNVTLKPPLLRIFKKKYTIRREMYTKENSSTLVIPNLILNVLQSKNLRGLLKPPSFLRQEQG